MKGKTDSNINEGEESLSIYPVGTLRLLCDKNVFSHIFIILTSDGNDRNTLRLVPCL